MNGAKSKAFLRPNASEKRPSIGPRRNSSRAPAAVIVPSLLATAAELLLNIFKKSSGRALTVTAADIIFSAITKLILVSTRR